MNEIGNSHLGSQFAHDSRESGLRDIWSAPWSELSMKTWAYGIDIENDRWSVAPSIIRGSLSKRTLNFNIKFPRNFCLNDQVRVRRRLKRLSLIYGFVAVNDIDGVAGRLRIRSAKKRLSPSSWFHSFRSVLVLAELSLETCPIGAVSDKCPDGLSLFSHLPLHQLQEMVDAGHSTIVNSYGRLDLQFRSGYFDDWVSGIDIPKRTRQANRNKTQPFEDRELSRVLESSLKLSAASEEVALAFVQYRKESTVKLGNSKHAERRKKWLQIATNLYRLAGEVVDKNYLEGGQLLLVESDGRSRVAHYLRSMLRATQMANAGLIAFGCGLRPEELDNLRRDCATKREGLTYFSGTVFKGDDTGIGVPRDWPLPDISAKALERQNKVAKIIEPDLNGLWVDRLKLSGSESHMTASGRFSQHFRDLMDANKQPMSDIYSITIYRIRTSAARLVALSVRGGTVAAFFTLGHKTIAETVAYYNARGDWDKEFSDLIEQVKEALGDSLFSEVKSGSAPSKLRDFVGPLLQIVDETTSPANGCEVTGEQDILSAQRALGATFQIVRKGVLCSAHGWSRGKCSERRGDTDFTKCVSDCTWRFETSAVLDDLRDVVDSYLEEWMALQTEDQLVRVHAAGTIVEALTGRGGLIAEYRKREDYKKFIVGLSDVDFGVLPEAVKNFCKTERSFVEDN